MRKQILFSWLYVLSLGIGPAHAEPTKPDGAIMRLVFAETGQGSVAPERRKQLAGAIVAFWKDLDSKIPRNPPAVAEWLSKELKSGDMERMRRAASTPEYALSELAQLSDGCLSDAQLAYESISTTPLFELYAWLRVAGCYGNPTGTEHHMKQASLSKGLFDGPLTMAHATLLHSFITGRIGNSIISEAR